MEDDQSYPSIGEQAKNLAKFTFEVVGTALNRTEDDDLKALLASPEIREKRLEICRACEYYDEKQVRCRKCGCFLTHKVKFTIDSCPLDKWREIRKKK